MCLNQTQERPHAAQICVHSSLLYPELLAQFELLSLEWSEPSEGFISYPYTSCSRKHNLYKKQHGKRFGDHVKTGSEFDP